jgi:hypothetical protein
MSPLAPTLLSLLLAAAAAGEGPQAPAATAAQAKAALSTALETDGPLDGASALIGSIEDPQSRQSLQDLLARVKTAQSGTDGSPQAVAALRDEISALSGELAIPGEPSRMPDPQVVQAYLARVKGQPGQEKRPNGPGRHDPPSEPAPASAATIAEPGARLQNILANKNPFGTAVPPEDGVVATAAPGPLAGSPGVLHSSDFRPTASAYRGLKISDVPEPVGLPAPPVLKLNAQEFDGEKILGYGNSTMKLRAAVAYDANQALLQDTIGVNKRMTELQSQRGQDCASLASASCLANTASLGLGYSKRALDGIGLKMTGANGVEETGWLAYSFTPIGAVHASVKDVIEDPSSKGNWGMLALSVLPFSGALRTAARGLEAGETFADYAVRVGAQAAENAELVEASASEGTRLARLTEETRGNLTKARDMTVGQINEDERPK